MVYISQTFPKGFRTRQGFWRFLGLTFELWHGSTLAQVLLMLAILWKVSAPGNRFLVLKQAVDRPGLCLELKRKSRGYLKKVPFRFTQIIGDFFENLPICWSSRKLWMFHPLLERWLFPSDCHGWDKSPLRWSTGTEAGNLLPSVRPKERQRTRANLMTVCMRISGQCFRCNLVEYSATTAIIQT